MFHWDPREAAANAAKHGVEFAEAATVFAAAEALEGPDAKHSAEARRLRLGRSQDGRVLMVAYTLREDANGEAIRIISARRASRRERRAYAGED